MTIEKIACPRLNIRYQKEIGDIPKLDVFVRFAQEIPKQIMCYEFSSSSNTCKLDSEKCTYYNWEDFS